MGAVDKIETRAGRCKLGILLFGIFVVVLGMHSHFESDWRRYAFFETCSEIKSAGFKCPGISMEKYFVVVLVLTYILSVVNLVICLLLGYKTFLLKAVDIGYHVVAAVLILIGAIVFIVSTEQIQDVSKFGNFVVLDSDFNQRPAVFYQSEKLAVGALAVIQSLLYGVTAIFIWLE